MSGITLINDLVRALATPKGALDAMGVLNNLAPPVVTQGVIRDAARMRRSLIDAKRMVLADDFRDLCQQYAEESKPAGIAAIMQFGMPPFSPLWVEWTSIEHDSSDDARSRVGVLIDYSGECAHVNQSDVVNAVLVYDVPSRGGAITVHPLKMMLRFIGAAFDYSQVMDVALSDGTVTDMNSRGSLIPDSVRHSMMKLIRNAWSDEIPFPDHDGPDLSWMAERVMVTPEGAAGDFLYAGNQNQDHRYHTLFKEQLVRAHRLLGGAPQTVGIALGMISLAPIRHLVDAVPWKRDANQPESNWRWKLDHNTVTLRRPIRVAEVVRHVRGTPAGRPSPAMHDVIGHWRVRGGRPSCNHRWGMRFDKDGHRMGSQQFLCGECAGVRSWVTAHTAGSALRGVVSNEYEVTV